MRLSVSNIAWDVSEDAEMAALFRLHGVDAIDIAPGKYFPDPASATLQEMSDVRNWWQSRGISITGMQALLFGTMGLDVFGTAASQQALLAHLRSVCRIGAALDAKRLVFGSPKNRDRSGLEDGEAFERGVEFFARVAGLAGDEGVIVCLEPNPPRYGANFMTDSAETARVVREVRHPSIRMQFDTGAIAINGEDPEAVLADFGDLIGHIHASEPDLVPLSDGGCDHDAMAAAIRRHVAEPLVTIEMVATRSEPHRASIDRAIAAADRSYRRPSVEAS